MEIDLEEMVDAAWREFFKRHPYAGKTHEAVFKFSYVLALKEAKLIEMEPVLADVAAGMNFE